MKDRLILILFVLFAGGLLQGQSLEPASPAKPSPLLEWRQIAPVPNREGFAGSFAGVSGGALLVGGGANFPFKKPWEGGEKVWHDTVFILEKESGEWRMAGKLPRPLAYGVSVSTPEGVLCMGGSDANGHFKDCFLLQWARGKMRLLKMASLPAPCANMCGALVGHVVFLAGGSATPTATNALNSFWSLDLSARRPRWQVMESWPGPARMLGVAGVENGCFYLFSGVDLHLDTDGKPARTYLCDAYCYRPGREWHRLPDLPRAVAAAPSPALKVGDYLLVASGDDGSKAAFQPQSLHPGFGRSVVGFNTRRQTWEEAGQVPFSRATVPVVDWQGSFVVPSGEARPGVRSPEVWLGRSAF